LSPRINPWLEQQLSKLHSPSRLELIIETQPNQASQVATDLAGLPNLTVSSTRISWGKFIPIAVPRELIPQILQIPGVVEVHYNAPKTIGRFSPPRILDPLIGEVRLSEVEVPGSPFDRLLTLSPLAIFLGPSDSEYEFMPTSKIRELMAAPEDNTITTRVAVLDTGAPLFVHPMATRPIIAQSVIAEPPWDVLGHGTWCHTAAFLGKAATRFGVCRSVADALDSLHVKCLNGAGFGSTDDVLKAMDVAYKWGAKVISLSLGGPLQGSALHDDVESKVINETKDAIWVVAAGNEGKAWSIESPGASPQALTVGSYSPKYGDVSVFSSRGPNGQFYSEHPDVWAQDLAEAGEDLLKPDVLAPGGGPCSNGQKPIDLIYSGSQGWTDGDYDQSIDGFAPMRGSSMATAVAAGLIALLYEKKGLRTSEAIKSAMRKNAAEKDPARGYGLLRYDLF
jgi:subtilisin family serine protease